MAKIKSLLTLLLFSTLLVSGNLTFAYAEGSTEPDYSLLNGSVNSSRISNTIPFGVYPVQKPDLKNIDKVPTSNDVNLTPLVNRSTLLSMLNAKEIAHIYIDETDSGRVVGVTINGVIFQVNLDDALVTDITKAGFLPTYIKFKVTKNNTLKDTPKTNRFALFYSRVFLPILLIGGSLWIYKRRFRKIKIKVVEGETAFETRNGEGGSIPTVKFSDVAGCEEAIEDLKELAEFLKDPTRFHELGAKVPRGAILAGPPGTGKTLLARAVAGEAGVPFYSAAGSDFVEMYVGVGASRIRDLFAKARKNEKAIIFIDEIDAVAKTRSGKGSGQGNEERENTLNALLHELDGFSRSNIILLAATNMVEMLDPAITRPGRLDRKISVPNPDRKGREAILKIHSKDIPLDSSVDLELIAKRTPGMSGADLSQVCNEAAIEAVRKGLKKVNASCFSDAVALVVMGRARKSAVVTDRDRLITAWHEAGHTICALRHHDAPDPVSVSITPRGHAGGITWMSGSDDNYLARSQAAAELVVAMGGRAGEELLLNGEFTQGPSSDLQRATELAKAMATQYGMTRRGLMVRPNERDGDTSEVIEELLKEALNDARALLIANQPLLEAVVDALLANETLEHHEILDIESSISPDNLEGNLHKAGERTMNLLKNVSHASIETVSEVASEALALGKNTLQAGVRTLTKNSRAKNNSKVKVDVVKQEVSVNQSPEVKISKNKPQSSKVSKKSATIKTEKNTEKTNKKK